MKQKPSDYSNVQFVEIGENQSGQRLDNFLLKTLKSLPRTRLYRIIRKGEVRVNKKRVKPEYKLRVADVVRIPPIRIDNQQPSAPKIPQGLIDQLEQQILFENHAIIILDKPAGLAVHSGSGVSYGAIDAMRLLRQQTDIELVHRLDRDTSGCLMFAKHRQSLLEMQRLLQSNEIGKTYQAVVKGHWDRSCRMIDLPLLRQTMPNGERRVYVDANGQPAQTEIVGVEHALVEGIEFSVLTIRLLTGRTHQIRVHCQSQQHQIAGDDKYGDREFNRQMKSLGCKRMLLHALQLEIPKTAYTKAMKLTAPVPREFRLLGIRNA
ncbi:MAG: RluA family pseudouridine synthase [Gammaproteobacteria bacterium]|nr:RluA family pseudouridine synthase [Gammaproteobacteria bacterium]